MEQHRKTLIVPYPVVRDILREKCMVSVYYCKFRNFRVTFISRIFDFRIISEFLNLRASISAVYKAYRNSLIARM